jgi:hypothetical protein
MPVLSKIPVQSNENICIVAPEGTNKRSIDDIVQ